MTTQELVEQLRERADRWDADTYDECWEVKETPIGKSLRAAASRLSELQDEVVRLREALADLTSWFTDLPLVHNVWIIPAGERGADGAVNAARAALDQQGERG